MANLLIWTFANIDFVWLVQNATESCYMIIHEIEINLNIFSYEKKPYYQHHNNGSTGNAKNLFTKQEALLKYPLKQTWLVANMVDVFGVISLLIIKAVIYSWHHHNPNNEQQEFQIPMSPDIHVNHLPSRLSEKNVTSSRNE